MKQISLLLLVCTIGLFVSCNKNNNEEKKDRLEAVDLGLSVKWASWNVGASSKYELGSFFAWGEITPKTNFTKDGYRFGTNLPDGYTKYNDTDKKRQLDIEDDAAHAVMGGSWRMPTFAEVRELIDKCSWKWVDEINEQGKLVRGFEVTGSTQNSIFIPMGESNTDNHTDGAAYMSSTIEHKLLTDEDYSSVRGLYLMKNEVTVFWMMRFRGNQVRAVCK